MSNQRKTILGAKDGRLERLKISHPLPHIDSHWCWCDPIVEVNEDGDQLEIRHKDVTWN
jgi:hypothetical protein